jgi:hypothetical protein
MNLHNAPTWLNWLLARLKEPSTWSGASVVAVAAHQFLPGSTADAALAVGAAVGGLLAVLMPENPA